MTDVSTQQEAWRSLMLYHGGLTFYPKDPKRYLKIPNRIAADRIARTVIREYSHRESIQSALSTLQNHGRIGRMLNFYRRLMVERDVHFKDFDRSEESHRDSFFYSIIHTFFHPPYPNFPLTKVT